MCNKLFEKLWEVGLNWITIIPTFFGSDIAWRRKKNKVKQYKARPKRMRYKLIKLGYRGDGGDGGDGVGKVAGVTWWRGWRRWLGWCCYYQSKIITDFPKLLQTKDYHSVNHSVTQPMLEMLSHLKTSVNQLLWLYLQSCKMSCVRQTYPCKFWETR